MKKNLVLIGTLTVAAALLTACTSNSSLKDIKTLSKKDAQTELTSYFKKIRPEKATLKRDLDNSGLQDAAELPPIDKTYPLSVKGDNQINAEIFVSPEKSGTGKDGLFNELAESFNSQHVTIDGKTVSVSIRTMPSGTGADYITTNNYKPDGYSPSNTQWGYMLSANGTQLETLADRTVGNTGGLLMKSSLYDKLVKSYGQVDMNALVNAIEKDGKLLGYTNPYTSSTGLSLLTQLLYHFDNANPLSDTARKDIQKFQHNLPSTFINTPQLREVAKNGSADILSISYQTYINTPEFAKYKFVPMGIRHDSPMYAVDGVSPDKKQVLQKFTEFINNAENQKKASDFGFNQLNDYSFKEQTTDGALLNSMQRVWKENKSGGKPVIGVFVADTSGSMDGEPLNALKKSLLNSSKYISDDTQIGLVSYSDNVTVNLPIAPMDGKQRSYFTGAVKGLQADGSTATYDATLVAVHMLMDKMKDNPDARPVIFVLSDGQTNAGYSFNNIAPIIKSLGITVNTIGYNSDLKELKLLSDINESATINAKSEDVVYQLKQLFNAEF